MEIRISGADEMKAEAVRFIATLQAGDTARVVALSGELGAGKTTFVQAAAKALGVNESVTSPTFVIEKIYALQGQKFERLIHIDAYRLKDAHELEVLGWKEIVADPSNLIMIEWPERVPELIPETAIRIRLDIEGDGRIITINGQESSGEGEEKFGQSA